jgi:hypothetical protein
MPLASFLLLFPVPAAAQASAVVTPDPPGYVELVNSEIGDWVIRCSVSDEYPFSCSAWPKSESAQTSVVFLSEQVTLTLSSFGVDGCGFAFSVPAGQFSPTEQAHGYVERLSTARDQCPHAQITPEEAADLPEIFELLFRATRP